MEQFLKLETCLLHKVHNLFRIGLICCCNSLFFKLSSARREGFLGFFLTKQRNLKEKSKTLRDTRPLRKVYEMSMLKHI